VRILRKRNPRRIVTVPREAHRHYNKATSRWAQCHTVRRVRLIRRRGVSP
jgi:hypothetical protein